MFIVRHSVPCSKIDDIVLQCTALLWMAKIDIRIIWVRQRFVQIPVKFSTFFRKKKRSTDGCSRFKTPNLAWNHGVNSPVGSWILIMQKSCWWIRTVCGNPMRNWVNICEDLFLPLRWGKKTPLQVQDRLRDDPHWFPGFLDCYFWMFRGQPRNKS